MTTHSLEKNMDKDGGLIATIPAHLLYWAHITETTSFHAGRFSSQAERVLPADVDSLHHCWVKLPKQGGWLMAGIEPERLRQYLAQRSDITPKVWALVPSEIPPHFPVLSTGARLSLNFLWGDFETEPSRRFRIATQWTVVFFIIVAVLVSLIGIERHRAAWLATTSAINQRTETRLAASLPGDATIPSDQRLTMALRRAEAAAGLSGDKQANIPAIIQTLLASLPRDMRVQTESLSVNSERITWRSRVTDLVQAERLHKACSSLNNSGYRLQPLQAQQIDSSALVVIDLLSQQVQP
jgi:hypothetical protein